MERYFAFVLRHRYGTLVCLLLVTVFFVAQYPRGRLATDVTQMFVDDPAIVDRYKRAVREFGSDEIIVVAFDAMDLFTVEGLRRLEQAVQVLEELPEVERALAVVSADRIKGTEDALIVRPYLDGLEETPEGVAALRAELAGHPLYRDLLISRDGQTAAVIIELTVSDGRPSESMVGLCAAIDAVLKAHGIGPQGRHQLGFPVNVAETILASQFNMARVFPLALVTVFLVGWALFRALWPTLLTLGVSMLAVVWVMGFAILISPDVNILVTITPVVILVLSFADVIHLTNTYITTVTDGVPKERAVLQTAADVGPACLFTSLTTMLGFASFASVPAQIMRQFAVVLGFGTGAALFIAVTLVPVLFAIFPAPEPRRKGLAAAHGSPIDRLLRLCETAVHRRPGSIIALSAAVAAACFYTASRLHVEVNFVHRFPPTHPVRVAHEFVQARLANANAAEIIIDTGAPDGVFDPAFLTAVREVQRQVIALPDVDSALTLTDLLAVIHHEMNAGQTPPGALPATRELVAQYILLYSFGGEDDLGRFVNFDRSRIRMAVRLRGNGMQETHDATNAILAIAERTLPPGAHASATGLMVIFGDVLQMLIRMQIRGLMTAAVTITAVFVIAFRSLRVALWAMVANFLPLLMFLGTIHWFDDHFDTDYIVIACVCLGIAVDDTIHFLNRYRLELRHTGGRVDESLHRTFEHTGKPIVQTTLIIILGFGAFNFCSYAIARAFGLMLGCTLVWALLADLLLLPVLIRAGLLRMAGTRASAA